MAIKKERGSNRTRGICKLAIDIDMTIYAIDELKKGFSEEIDSYDRFELNLGKVEDIDSSGIQLLLVLRKELVRKKKKLKLTVLSGVVTKLIEKYGISDRINIKDTA